MSDAIDIMNMARKAVEFDNMFAFLRQYLFETRGLDLLDVSHLVGREKTWWVCDLRDGKKGEMIYKSYTCVEALSWALGQPDREEKHNE